MKNKRISVLIVDKKDGVNKRIELIMKRFNTKHKFITPEKFNKNCIKKRLFFGLNYNIILVNSRVLNKETQETLREICVRFGNAVYSIIIVNNIDINVIKDYYRLGVNEVVPLIVLQSTLFNLYVEYMKMPMVKFNTKENEYNFCGHKVMVVEDNRMNMEVTEDLLNLVNVEVIEAKNGEEALNLFINDINNEIDLIFMDIQMPVMDGIETTKRIRGLDNPRAKEIKIIALTANTLPGDIKHALDAGMDDFIGKPIATKNLYCILKKYINK